MFMWHKIRLAGHRCRKILGSPLSILAYCETGRPRVSGEEWIYSQVEDVEVFLASLLQLYHQHCQGKRSGRIYTMIYPKYYYLNILP